MGHVFKCLIERIRADRIHDRLSASELVFITSLFLSETECPVVCVVVGKFCITSVTSGQCYVYITGLSANMH